MQISGPPPTTQLYRKDRAQALPQRTLRLSHQNMALWQSEYSGQSNALPFSAVSLPTAQMKD